MSVVFAPTLPGQAAFINGQLSASQEGARRHGYTGARGYHPLPAIAAGTGDVLMARLREGRANTARVDPLKKEPDLRRLHEEFTTKVRSYNSKYKALDEATDRVVWQLVVLNPDGSVS